MDKLLFVAPESMIASRTFELLRSKFEIVGAGISNEITPTLKLGSYDELDITDYDHVLAVLTKFPGQYFINFAAMTAVDEIEKTRPANPNDQAELNSNLAYKVNVIGTRNLAKAAKELGKAAIFISTDYVFNGERGGYDEEESLPDSADGLTWYGWTKVLAEKEFIDSGLEDYLIIRLSFPYRSQFEGKGDIARNWISIYDKFKSGELKQMYPIFTDQIFTPTFVDDLASALELLVSQKSRGIFHLASPQSVSMYDFACQIFKVARGVGDPEKIVPKGSLVKYMEEHTGYIRHKNSSLKSDKITKLGFRPTGWREGLKKAYGN